jgi:hypothetical protein
MQYRNMENKGGKSMWINRNIMQLDPQQNMGVRQWARGNKGAKKRGEGERGGTETANKKF